MLNDIRDGTLKFGDAMRVHFAYDQVWTRDKEQHFFKIICRFLYCQTVECSFSVVSNLVFPSEYIVLILQRDLRSTRSSNVCTVLDPEIQQTVFKTVGDAS